MARKAKPAKVTAAEVIDFVHKFILIPEGHAVGQPMKLMDWQVQFIVDVFDNPAGTRRAILSVGRKNSKSALIAALMLAYIVGPASHPNSQVFSAALSREQAGLIFGYMAKMVRLQPKLSTHIHIRDSAKEMICTLNGVKFKALSADASTAMGLSPVCFCYDEAGQISGPDSALFNALHTAQGAHASPIEFIISTQAATDADFLSQMIDDARTGADPHTVCHVYEAPPGADLMDEDGWKAANPSLGTISTKAFVKQLAEEAVRLPVKENSFRNLILNQRVSIRKNLIPLGVWKANSGAVNDRIFYEQPVFGGLDLSSRQDLTALVLIARDRDLVWHVRAHFWAPENGVRERAARDKVDYVSFADRGILTLTPGFSVDYRWISERLAQVADDFDLRSIGYDRWRFDDLQRDLAERHLELPLQPFGQGFRDMTPAIEALLQEALNGRLRHGDNPLLTWCAANTVPEQDAAGNMKANKAKSTGRIDGMVALIMAMGVASKAAPEINFPSYVSAADLAFV